FDSSTVQCLFGSRIEKCASKKQTKSFRGTKDDCFGCLVVQTSNCVFSFNVDPVPFSKIIETDRKPKLAFKLESEHLLPSQAFILQVCKLFVALMFPAHFQCACRQCPIPADTLGCQQLFFRSKQCDIT